MFREIETNKGEAGYPKRCYAGYFAERGGLVGILNMACLVIPPLNRILHSLQTVHNIRHCAIDHCVTEAYKQGCRQVGDFGELDTICDPFDFHRSEMMHLPCGLN